jgi:hypothetical protein
MGELSVFIDESGDFGPYERHAPYYIITLLFQGYGSKSVSHCLNSVGMWNSFQSIPQP